MRCKCKVLSVLNKSLTFLLKSCSFIGTHTILFELDLTLTYQHKILSDANAKCYLVNLMFLSSVVAVQWTIYVSISNKNLCVYLQVMTNLFKHGCKPHVIMWLALLWVQRTLELCHKGLNQCIVFGVHELRYTTV